MVKPGEDVAACVRERSGRVVLAVRLEGRFPAGAAAGMTAPRCGWLLPEPRGKRRRVRRGVPIRARSGPGVALRMSAGRAPIPRKSVCNFGLLGYPFKSSDSRLGFSGHLRRDVLTRFTAGGISARKWRCMLGVLCDATALRGAAASPVWRALNARVQRVGVE